MDRTRRDFIASTAAFAATTLTADFAQSADVLPRDGRAAITKAESDAMDVAISKGGFTCVRTAESGDGPYYYESSLRRRDVTEGRRGLPLKLGVRVLNATAPAIGCSPLAGAIVDLWQADADGMYSNVGSDLQNENTIGKTFMRGHQVTNAEGYVEFDTVVPGWELVASPLRVISRATHIHLKVFHEHKIATTQIYLPDAFLDEVYASVDPYRKHGEMTAPGAKGTFKRIRNTEDMVFNGDASKPVEIQRVGKGVTAQASIGIVTLGGRGVAPLFR